MLMQSFLSFSLPQLERIHTVIEQCALVRRSPHAGRGRDSADIADKGVLDLPHSSSRQTKKCLPLFSIPDRSGEL
jgi:hypothetical protein